MDQSLHAYMRPGIVLCAAFPGAGHDADLLCHAIEMLAQDDFFRVVELRSIPDDATRQRMMDVIRAACLDVIFEVHPCLQDDGLDLGSIDPVQRARALDLARRCIDEAISIGAERINIAGGHDPGAPLREQATDALVDSLYALAGYSTARNGAVLALEPSPPGPASTSLVGSAHDAVALVHLVRDVYPAFGLTLPIGPSPVDEETVSEMVVAAPCLGQVHLTPVSADRLDMPSQSRASGSAYDIPCLSDALLALFRSGFLHAGRRPPVVLRVVPGPRERPEWIVAGAKRALLEAWARL